MKMSIGFDVSKMTLDVAVFDGKETEHFKVANGKTGFDEIFFKIKDNSMIEISVTMEATGVYHQKAAEYFYNKGIKVYVVNPLIIKRYSEMKMRRAKTDKADSKIIAEYGFYEKSVLYKPKTENSLKIIGFLKAIDDLHHVKTQNTNRLEALSRCAFSFKDIEKIYERMNSQIDCEIKQIEKEILFLVKTNYLEAYQNLISIPGIGNRVSSAVIGYFGKMESFESAKQLVSFIGVNPSPRMSGSSVRGRGAISRKGNGDLRRLFYLASLSASKYNAACKALYQRLLEKGKDKKVALIAVSNKLIRQVYAVTKFERRYDPNFCNLN